GGRRAGGAVSARARRRGSCERAESAGQTRPELPACPPRCPGATGPAERSPESAARPPYPSLPCATAHETNEAASVRAPQAVLRRRRGLVDQPEGDGPVDRAAPARDPELPVDRDRLPLYRV